MMVLSYITLLCYIDHQYRIYTTYLQQVFRFIHRQLRKNEIAGTSQWGFNRPVSNLNKNIYAAKWMPEPLFQQEDTVLLV